MATRRAVPAATGPPVPHRRQWAGKGGKWSTRGKEARRSDREARRRWQDRRSEATHGGEDGGKPGRASGNKEGIGGIENGRGEEMAGRALVELEGNYVQCGEGRYAAGC